MSRSGRINHIWMLQVFSDFVAIFVAYYATLSIRFYSNWGIELFEFLRARLSFIGRTAQSYDMFEEFYFANGPRIILILALVLIPLYALRDLYAGRRFLRPRPLGWNVMVANAGALALFFGYFYMSRNDFHPRSFFLVALLLNAVFCVWFRRMLHRGLDTLRRRTTLDQCPVVLTGSGADAEFLNYLIEDVRPHGLKVAGRVPAAGADFEAHLEQIRLACREHDAGMIVSAECGLTVPQIMRVLELGDQLDVPVKILSRRLEVLVHRAGVPCDMIHNTPLVHFESPLSHRRQDMLARMLSALLAAAALWVLAVPLLAVALLIRLTSRGPVLFIQERVGVNRLPFRMYKFRTMYDQTEELLAQMEEFNEAGRGLFKMKHDPRVTPIGRLLRRLSLDELPQLFNIIKGDMTVVGPRPLPRRDFAHYYEEWHYSRHGGMPGLTCLWQVSGRSDVDFHNMCILDVYYLSNHGWTLDLKIILRTFWVVVFGRGAY